MPPRGINTVLHLPSCLLWNIICKKYCANGTSKDRDSSGWKIRNTLLRSETVPRLVQMPQSSPGSKDLGRSDPRSVRRVGRGGSEAVSARYRHQQKRVQWAIRHTVLCEKTERDDDESTIAGQSPTGQAGEISRGHAEAHAQVRSSGVW